MTDKHESYVQKAEESLQYLIAVLPSPYQGYIMSKTMDSKDFQTSPASTKHHHVYSGGLLVHTAEIAFIARSMWSALFAPDFEDGVNKKLMELLVAALLHDAEKVKDYQKEREEMIVGGKIEWSKTEHAKRIYHIVDGVAEFRAFSKTVVDPLLDHAHIEHMLLAHHGQPEWGSPVTPQTPEAYILHAADMLSLKAGHTRETTESNLHLYRK